MSVESWGKATTTSVWGDDEPQERQQSTNYYITRFYGNHPRFAISSAAKIRKSHFAFLFATLPNRFILVNDEHSVQDNNNYFEGAIINALKNLNINLVDPSILVSLEVKGKNITICFSEKKHQQLLLKEGLKLPEIEGILRFRGERKRTFQITVLGVPMEITDQELGKAYETFGKIAQVYSVKKFYRGQEYKNGNRVVVFASLQQPIPKNCSFGDKTVTNRFRNKDIPKEICESEELKAFIYATIHSEKEEYQGQNKLQVMEELMRVFLHGWVAEGIARQPENPNHASSNPTQDDSLANKTNESLAVNQNQNLTDVNQISGELFDTEEEMREEEERELDEEFQRIREQDRLKEHLREIQQPKSISQFSETTPPNAQANQDQSPNISQYKIPGEETENSMEINDLSESENENDKDQQIRSPPLKKNNQKFETRHENSPEKSRKQPTRKKLSYGKENAEKTQKAINSSEGYEDFIGKKAFAKYEDIENVPSRNEIKNFLKISNNKIVNLGSIAWFYFSPSPKEFYDVIARCLQHIGTPNPSGIANLPHQITKRLKDLHSESDAKRESEIIHFFRTCKTQKTSRTVRDNSTHRAAFNNLWALFEDL